MDMGTLVRYSEAFKLHVVRELEEGRHVSLCAASEAYGIGGAVTVRNWVSKYGKTHLLKRVIRVETADERNELQRLKARNRELEKALVDAHLDLRLERAWMELACEAGGVESVDEFKKKHGGMPCIGLAMARRPSKECRS